MRGTLQHFRFNIVYTSHLACLLMGCFDPAARTIKYNNQLVIRSAGKHGSKWNIYFSFPSFPAFARPYSLPAPTWAFLLTPSLLVTSCAKRVVCRGRDMAWVEEGREKSLTQRHSFVHVEPSNFGGWRNDWITHKSIRSSLYLFSFLSWGPFVEILRNFLCPQSSF